MQLCLFVSKILIYLKVAAKLQHTPIFNPFLTKNLHTLKIYITFARKRGISSSG